MLIEDTYNNLPADPELAFIQLERGYRAELAEAMKDSEHSNDDMHYLAYINQTHAAAHSLGLGIFEKWQIPNHRGNLYDAYKDFSINVEHYLVQIKVRHGRRTSGYSVALDPASKAKLQHYITQIREIVLKLEVTPRKKEALIAKITALSDEVDRDRTRMEVYAAVVMEVATTGGVAARKLKPLKEILDSAAKVLGFAKDAEDARPSLPASEERKRLAAPLRDVQVETPQSLDDELPF